MNLSTNRKWPEMYSWRIEFCFMDYTHRCILNGLMPEFYKEREGLKNTVKIAIFTPVFTCS
jgi:hypothetical protein